MSQRRRLLVVLSGIFNARGGIPRFNQMLCMALDRMASRGDMEVRILSQDDAEADYRAAGSPWDHAQFFAGGGSWRTLMRAVAQSASWRPDAMITGLLGMAPAGLLSRPFLRRGYAFIAHGVEVWPDHPLCDRRRSRHAAGRRAATVYAVSRYTGRECMRMLDLPSERVALLPNTLEPDFEVFDEASADDGVAELLTVSRLWPSEKMKGVDHAIRAFAAVSDRYPEARYRIVGKGDDRPRLERLAVDKGVGDRVQFEQDLSDEELAERYRRCRAFVLPSGQEGFGIVFLEAMRFSRPCIGGAHGGTPEVIADGRTGFLVPFGDGPALEQAMERLLGDPRLAESMGEAGRQRLLDVFVFDRFQERVERNIEALLDGRTGDSIEGDGD